MGSFGQGTASAAREGGRGRRMRALDGPLPLFRDIYCLPLTKELSIDGRDQFKLI